MYAIIQNNAITTVNVPDPREEFGLQGWTDEMIADPAKWSNDLPTAMVGVAYYRMVSAPDPTFDSVTQTLSAPAYAIVGITAVGTRSVVALDAATIKANKIAAVDAELTKTDREFDPRWHEDARAGGQPHAREQAWLDKRAALRAQRTAIVNGA